MKAKVLITVVLVAITSIFLVKGNNVELTGKVEDYAGMGVMYTSLEIYSENGQKLVQKAFSDIEGKFEMKDLKPGEYKLVVKAPGFEETVQTVEVSKSKEDLGSIQIEGNVITLPPAIILGKA